jgi:iron complex outermembrane recepter protein
MKQSPEVTRFRSSSYRLRKYPLIPGLLLGVFSWMSSSVGFAAQEQNTLPVLKELSLEQLMDLEVTSVAKKEQRLGETAAAIYVITQEEIRRSGVTSIPEALRLAPGVQVNRIDSNKWSIGVRGFASRLSRSVLVLIDGRSVYNPLFAGVYWEVQDTLMEDIDRIEVIRGPGGTLWGANAVNGVINIITKNATETHGLLATAGGGSEEKTFGGLRYGGKIGDDFSYRVYGKGFVRDAEYTPHVSDFDGWHMGQGGFRTDWNLNKNNSLTVQGDIYAGKSGQRGAISNLTAPFLTVVQKDADFSGMNLLGRWTRALSEKSNLVVQVYYDRTFRREPIFQEDRNTFDFDLQHRFQIIDHHELIWGLGYRYSKGDTESVPAIVFTPPNRSDHLFSAFLQDEIMLVENRLRLTIGSKFEHNDYSGFEVQPSARLLWTPAERHYVWASVSRAVRTPSRVEHDLLLTAAVNPAVPLFARVIRNKNFEAEKVLAYELGYRVQATDRLSVDLAAFHNRYNDMLSLEGGSSFIEPPGHTIFPFAIDNNVKADVYGIEVATDWRWLDWWRWRFSYAYQQLNLRKKRGSTDISTEASTEGSTPHNQIGLLSFIDLPANAQLDGVFRYVDNLPSQKVGRYFNFDLRLSWHANKNLELSVVGQNLLAGHHAEWSGGTQIQRGIYSKATWRW